MATTTTAAAPAPASPAALTWRQRLRRWLRPPRRLKFTRLGRYFTGMTLLVGFGAINTGNNLLYLLLGMMLSIIVVSGVLSEQVIQRLRVRHRLPERIFAGHAAPIEVTLENPRPRVPSFSIEVVERIAGVPDKERPAAYFLRIDAGGTAIGGIRYAFPRRGRTALEGFEIVTHFPFGLFRKSREIDEAEEIVVFPALRDPGPLAGLAELPQGEVRQPRPGRGGDYYGLRDYRQGDDLRDIHWKAVARRGELITREREHEEARRIIVGFVNAWPAAREAALAAEHGEAEARRRVADALERAVEVCAGLIQRLLAEGYVVGLATLDVRVPYGSGSGQLDRALRELALASFHGDPRRAALPQATALDVGAAEACVLVGLEGELERWRPARVLATVPCALAPAEAKAKEQR